jgi:hypothetical protein
MLLPDHSFLIVAFSVPPFIAGLRNLPRTVRGGGLGLRKSCDTLHFRRFKSFPPVLHTFLELFPGAEREVFFTFVAPVVVAVDARGTDE